METELKEMGNLVILSARRQTSRQTDKRTSHEERKEADMCKVPDGMECIFQGGNPKAGICMPLLPARHKVVQAAKRFFGSRAAAPILSAAMTGWVYRYCAALAYIERGGKTAYGGECLAALAAGFFTWQAVRNWNWR